jgi:hypothetical protein
VNNKHYHYSSVSLTAMSDPRDNERVERVKLHVAEAQGRMRENLELVIDNHIKLQDMEKTSEDLLKSSEVFERNTKTVRRKACWKTYKWNIGMCVCVVIIILLIIVIPITVKGEESLFICRHEYN